MKANGMRALIGVLILAGGIRAEEPDIDFKPIRFGAMQEFGMLRDGFFLSSLERFHDEWLDHFGSYFSDEAVVDGHLVVKAGIGGVFEFPKPEDPQEQFGGSQYKGFFVGPSIAEAMYHFGGVEHSVFSLGGGLFPYKYNPDAADLGEYLFRSIPYPSAVFTGGLNVIGDNAAYLEGFRASANLDGFKLDVILNTETNVAPLYDWSLGFVADYSIAGGLLDLGAGVDFKRLFEIHTRKTSVHDLANSYFSRGGKWYVGDKDYYGSRGDFFANLAGTVKDSGLARAYAAAGDSLHAIADSINPGPPVGLWLDPATNQVPGASYYTAAGTLLMARASLVLKKVVPLSGCKAEDMRLFAETAVLGVKDYPIYYEKMTDRMPIMVGFNAPTFGVLDLLSLQFEYYNSPNLNNIFNLADKNWAIPYFPAGQDSSFSGSAYNDLTKKDNYSWSILMRKTFLNCFSLSGQIARDHYRTVGAAWWYASRLEPQENLYKSSKSWYWVLQMGWSI